MEYQSSPKRPYLLRAYYDWLSDNDFTPYLVVDATYGFEKAVDKTDKPKKATKSTSHLRIVK